MPAAGYVVVSTQPSQAEAELLAGLLRSGGMPVLVEGTGDAEYPTGVAGGYRVTVPAERATDAEQLLARAEHIDPTDPASSLDVGVPVDEDVRDYLAWRSRTAGDDDGDEEAAPHPASVEHVTMMMTGQHARGLPLLPLLALVALAVALVIWLR